MNKEDIFLTYYDDDFKKLNKTYATQPPTPPVEDWDMIVVARDELRDGWLKSFTFDAECVISDTKIDGNKGYIKFAVQPITIRHTHHPNTYSEFYYADSIKSINYILQNEPCKVDVVKLPNSLTTVNQTVFDGCTLLNSSVLSNCTITTPIAENAIWDAPFIPTGTVLPNRMFYGCVVPNINDVFVYFSSKDKTIGYYAFCGSNLSGSISIANELIKEYTFANTNLTTISIEETVTSVEAHAFSGCNQLSVVNFVENNNSLVLGNYVFANTAITELDLTNRVTTFTTNTFHNMTSLQKLTINAFPTTVSTTYWFTNTSIDTLVIDDSVTAFPKTLTGNIKNINRLFIGKNITVINASCIDVKYIYLLATTPPSFLNTSTSFYFAKNSETVYVPVESLEIYKSNSNYRRIVDKIQPII